MFLSWALSRSGSAIFSAYSKHYLAYSTKFNSLQAIPLFFKTMVGELGSDPKALS